MPRSFDDDAASRMRAADEHLSAEQREARDEELAEVRALRREGRRGERELARRRLINRIRRWAAAIAAVAVVTAASWTLLRWGSPSRYVKADIVCGAALVLAAAAAWGVGFRHRDLPSRAELEDELDSNREALRFYSTLVYPSLGERRSLYREDVAGFIEQYQAESRRYRAVHNTLQSLIMIGSTATTTVAALDSGDKLTWQNVTIVTISFAITLAAAFTGYYKYRERSYFLQQTADAIEEEANAFALGVGKYGVFGPEQDQEALAVFTLAVEDLRNEQRRRQQQLDQPAEQATSGGTSPA
ncbi:DUF4231 domain-containing protein [Streptomyces sp. NPDC086519]|uniref:DUF4231 domain-containing protein n=1 Tax=Streptomyces sp. NPDC086519 TaxID=3154863 RepID=UPI00341A2239